MSKEKKKTIILTVVLGIVCLILIGVFIVDNLKQNGTIVSEETKEVMNEFDKYFNSKKRTVIYYASEGCGYCKLQTPILETIAEDYDMDYYYLDSSKLTVKQRNEVLEKLEIEQKTPTTIIVENGKVIDTAVGYTQGSDYVEFFKKSEIIPEDAVYSKEQYITYVDFSEYEELISDSDTNIIVVGQTSCSHCIAFKPALNSVAQDYDLTINYLNLTDLSKEESTSFFDSLTTIEYNDEKFLEDGSFGTPLTLVVENGKVKSYISGERTISQLVREFKRQGLISEE